MNLCVNIHILYLRLLQAIALPQVLLLLNVGVSFQLRIGKIGRGEGGKECEEIKIYPHLFRHTFVTRCYEAGVDPMTIALIVGHSREKMVIHYTHISKEFQKKDFVKYEEQEKERILSDSE